MSDKHHRYYKHTKFRQNPRGDPKFLVDLTWNDPLLSLASQGPSENLQSATKIMSMRSGLSKN